MLKYKFYFLLLLYVLFLVDFGFSHSMSRPKRIALKITTAILTTIENMVVPIFMDATLVTTIIVIIFNIPPAIRVFVLLVTPEKHNVINFFDNIKEINSRLGCTINYYPKMMVYSVFATIISLMMAAIKLTEFNFVLEEVYINYHICASVSSHNVVIVFYSLIFYAAHRALNDLKGQVEFQFQRNDEYILHAQKLYKSIADTLDIVKEYFDYLYFITFCEVLPHITKYIYEHHALLSKASTDEVNTTTTMFAANSFINMLFLLVVFIPVVIAGMVESDADDIKILLYDGIFRNIGGNNDDCLQFISYIETRPLRYKALSVIPLNPTLIPTAISFVATYAIVLLQLTRI